MAGTECRAANATSWSRWLAKNGSAPITSAPTCAWLRVLKAASISLSVPAFRIRRCTSFVRRFLRIADDRVSSGIFRVHKPADHIGLRYQLGHQLEPLCNRLACHDADACE